MTDWPVFALEMLLLGIATGLTSASLGLGGGIVMVPGFLQFVPGIDIHTAKGSSLLIIVFVSALNAWQEKRHDPHENWRLAGVLALSSVIGAYASGWVTARMPERSVAIIFMIFLAGVAYRTLRVRERPASTRPVRERIAIALGIGFVTGVTSGATGTGGGAVLVPLALLAGLVENRRAVVLSNTVMVATCTAAALAHAWAPQTTSLPYTYGQVNLALAPVVFAGAVLGSPLGRRLNRHLTLPRRRVVMGLWLLLIAGRMLYEAVK